MNKDTFINTYLERIKTLFSFKSIDQSFEIFSIAAILDRSFDEIYSNDLINDKADGGIDGIYFEEGFGNIIMHVFQCKNTNKLSQNALEKFSYDVRKIFEEGKYKPNSLGLKQKIEYYKEKSKYNIIKTKHYFVFKGNKNDKQTANNSLYAEFHKPDYYEIWDSNDLYEQIESLINSLNKRKNIKFTFNPLKSNITSSRDYQGLITFSIYTTTATIFRISAIELCELLNEEKRINGSIEKIFSENIRGFLGRENLANAKILETLKSSDNIFFPVLNNDITIICENIQIPYSTQDGKYIIPCVNPVIVNGLQTTYLIYQQYIENKESIKDVTVSVKLCETSDLDLIEKITDATNTQSVITFKDKLSNKKFNIFTKELFKNKGIGYISKRGEVFSQFQENLLKTIQSERLLQLWYATFLEKPFDAKFKRDVVYKDIFDASIKKSHLLHTLFCGDIDSALYGQLLLVYQIYEISRREIKNYKGIDFVNVQEKIEILGYEYFCFMVYKLLKEETSDFTEIKLIQITNIINELLAMINFEKIHYSLDVDTIEQVFDTTNSKIEQYFDIFYMKGTTNLAKLKINTANIL